VAACLASPWLLPGTTRAVADAVTGAVTGAVSGHGGAASADVPEGRVVPVRALRGELAGAGVPVGLDVARLSVRSAVVPISGTTGVLLPPSDPQLLGWWREGAVPGSATGTAVLTGHTVHAGGGAFDHLSRLAAGDRLRVRTTRGRVEYAVARVSEYGRGALARHAGELFTTGGAGRLVLVTCSDWDGTAYRANTVVVAVPTASDRS
jgi:LPXTG-site transpeptidase (sortase) family protein